jgi:hypothetical protein
VVPYAVVVVGAGYADPVVFAAATEYGDTPAAIAAAPAGVV